MNNIYLDNIPVATSVQMAPIAVDLKELCSAFIEMRYKIRQLEHRIDYHERHRTRTRLQICVLTLVYMIVTFSWICTYVKMTSGVNDSIFISL